MKIAFKDKLSFSTSLIIISILTGIFLFLQADLKEDAVIRSKALLITAQELVSDLVEARVKRLYELAAGIGKSEAVHDILNNPAQESERHRRSANFTQLP